MHLGTLFIDSTVHNSEQRTILGILGSLVFDKALGSPLFGIAFKRRISSPFFKSIVSHVFVWMQAGQ